MIQEKTIDHLIRGFCSEKKRCDVDNGLDMG